MNKDEFKNIEYFNALDMLEGIFLIQKRPRVSFEQAVVLYDKMKEDEQNISNL
jgi:hypothetical protein